MTALELKELTKSFGGVRAVKRVSIGFQKAKITGLVGPNGAGKTTLFNLISGLLTPESGSILYLNRDLVGSHPWQIAQMGIGRLFQDVRVFNRMTLLDNVLSAFKHQPGENPLLSLLLPWKVKAHEDRLRARALELLSFVELADKAHSIAEELSYGQQKLLSIARLLAADADLLLLDEPTAGVNPRVINSLLQLIRRLAHEGKTIIVIEHNMNVVTQICDWVFFMEDGQVVSFGLPHEVLSDPEVRSAYIGL